MSKEIKTFSNFLAQNKDLLKAQINAALPKHMNADRMIRILSTELRRVPELNECTLQSVLSSIIQASQLGLEVSSLIGHGYLVPFKKKDKETGKYIKECQFIIGYRGMIDLARRSGKLISLSSQSVYENDHFDFKYGLEEKLDHIPYQGEDRGKFIGAYAIAKLDKGSYQFGVMFKNEIDKIKARSKSSQSDYSPWTTDYEEMAKKTVIRRLFKYLPISIELYENLIKEEIKEISGDVLLLEEQESNIPLIQTKSEILANKISQQQEIKITEQELPQISKEFFGE
ncbi:MAG: recombination protein RecT [Candidatus Nitrosocosmicus sp.]